MLRRRHWLVVVAVVALLPALLLLSVGCLDYVVANDWVDDDSSLARVYFWAFPILEKVFH